ncbi:MAG: DUF6710 family protein [Paeniclostridium sordellii]|nr:DUF6710 family protein [Paeniclostridium sordellii]
MIFKKIFSKENFNGNSDDQNGFCNNLYLKDNLIHKEKFDNIINFAKYIIDTYDGENATEHPILDFIRIIGRRIQSDYMGYLLYSGKYENESRDLRASSVLFSINEKIKNENGNYIEIWDLIENVECNKTINLSKDLILPWPWNSNRIANNLMNIGNGRSGGVWKEDITNHNVNVWLPMGIAWVEGGNHSITIGIVQGGNLKPRRYHDISKLYKYIKCDGENFIEIHSGEVLSKDNSPEFAAIFEIGRMMVQKGISFADL